MAERYQGQLPAAPPWGGATTALPEPPPPTSTGPPAASPAGPAFSRELLRGAPISIGAPTLPGLPGARAPPRPGSAGRCPEPRPRVRETRASSRCRGSRAQAPEGAARGAGGASKQRPRRSDRRGYQGPRRRKGVLGAPPLKCTWNPAPSLQKLPGAKAPPPRGLPPELCGGHGRLSLLVQPWWA